MAMNYRSKYVIAFKGLKNGEHFFNFEIDNLFFNMFEGSEISEGKLDAIVKLTRQETLLKFDVALKGTVELICDRCLETFNQKVDNKSEFYVKFGIEEEMLSDEIMVVPFEEHQVNIAQYLYEQVVLGLPAKRVHGRDKNGKSLCNPEMVTKLNNYLIDEDDEKPGEEIDDRWSELRKLLNNQ
ncbi:MAG: DUF177 domain-containing protein [Prolixibacteraceae bacterium]|nr:DUF177 domain-containing protein [Prolixibacteraceae bacterium]